MSEISGHVKRKKTIECKVFFERDNLFTVTLAKWKLIQKRHAPPGKLKTITYMIDYKRFNPLEPI